jgi:peptidoglycan/LPS O-acetylase OafA/YrhL
LAWFSWRFVEKPFRDRSRFTRTQIFSVAVLGSVLFMALGASAVFTDGFASRFAN